MTKILVVGEDIDPMDPLAVSWAFASRNHPKYGAFYFPHLMSAGMGPESYHAMSDFNALMSNDPDIAKGGSLVIYSCVGIEEHTGLAKPTFSSPSSGTIRTGSRKRCARTGRSGACPS